MTAPRPTVDQPNELLDYTIDSIMGATSEAFQELWSRDHADVLALGFLEGALSFVVSRDGVEVVHAPGADDE